MSRTGHRSTSVRCYKRPSSTLVKSVSNALQPPSAVDVPSPKKAKVDKEKETCGSTANTQETKTLLVFEHEETSMSFHFK